MRDDDLRSRLREVNPWWRLARSDSDKLAWTGEDRTLSERARYDFGYRSVVLDDLAIGPVLDSLVVLRGPRRVGKSAALKDLVVALCARTDVSPWQVVYMATDGLSARDLRRLFVIGRDLTRPADERRRIWLLDEVTGVDGWAAELKYARDNTPVGDDTVVCTGSSNAGAAEAERHIGVGRTGAGNRRFRLLLPMTFREVITHTDPHVPRPAPADPWRLQTPEVASMASEYDSFVDQLDLAWQRYLESGGFPRALAEHRRDGQASDAFVHDLEAWLRTDVDPDGPPESVPSLLGELHHRGSAPLNRRNIAESLGVQPSVIEKRLNRLVATLAAFWCPQRDEHGQLVAGAQSKFYLADPLLAALPSRLRSGTPEPDGSRLTEAALATALAHALDDSEPGRWVAGDTIGYLRTGSGKEIDFAPVPVATSSGGSFTVPIEAKWVSQGWRAEARGIEGRYGCGILATKSIIDTSHQVWAIPAPLVALLLG